MPEPDHALPDTFAVGDWTADRHSLSISRSDIVQTLEPRVFGVLRYLAERPQKLVTIDELMTALWPGVVVTPNAVTRVIAQLRKSLRDEAKQPRYIQTVSRSGYRLVAPVAAVERPRPRRLRLRYAGLAALAAAVAFAAWLIPDPKQDASIAVLPFANYTGDASLAYLGEGVAEEVINSLAQVQGLNVSARSLSFRFPGQENEARAFARELGVAFLVEGSVRLSGQQLRITAQVVSADSGFHVWSHTAEHNLSEVFAAQDAISNGVTRGLADALDLEVAQPARPGMSAPHPEAYDLYLRGRYVWHRRGIEPMQPAIDAFAEAVRIDPDFARGWAALAAAYLSYPNYSPEGGATWHLAEDAATNARALDPDISEVYGVLGTFAETRLQWVEAHALFVEGVRRDDQSATAHYWYSEHLAKTGRYRDSLMHLRRSLSLDPLYTAPLVDEGFTLLMFGDLESGAERFRQLWDAGTRSPTAWTGHFIGRILIGEYDDARRLIEAASFPAQQKDVLLRFVDVEANEADAAPLVEEIFANPELQPDHRLLTWFGSRLGAYDQVIAVLRARLADGRYVDGRPLWGPGTQLNRQPGFLQLADTMGLIDYWKTVAWGDICRPREEQIVCDAAALTAAQSEGQSP